MTTERREPCERGCIDARRHLEDCPREGCRGCAPRPATHGLLCESCHADLWLILSDAPRQVSELAANVEPSMQWSLTAQPASGKVGPRLDSSARDYIAAARSSMSAGEVETIRIATLDAARALEDAISSLVEHVASQWGADGPARLRTMHGDMRERRWRPAFPDGEPRERYAVVQTFTDELGQVERGQYVWVDPPARYAIDTACRWLREQIRVVEHTEGIGHTLETLRDLMARAHSLAPWREPGTPMRGVPCPQCHRCSLVLYNSPRGRAGQPDAQPEARCEAGMCGKVWPWAKIAHWTLVLEDERRKGERPGSTWTSERGA